MTPEELADRPRPWYNENLKGADRFGKFGEIMTQDEFYGLMKISDVFDLVLLEKDFTLSIKKKYTNHPVLNVKVDDLGEGEEASEIATLVENHIADGLYEGENL